MAGGQKRPMLARRPTQLVAFSPFARSLFFSSSFSSGSLQRPLATNTSASAEIPQENSSFDRNLPPPLRKRAKRDEPSSDEDSYSSNDNNDVDELETVQADFAFFDPKPRDFHGVKLLLQRYLNSKPWDLSGFVDLILTQTTVGTVVKLADDVEEREGNGDAESNGADDEDLFGVISVLNLGRFAEHQCIKELREYLLGICGDKGAKKNLKSLLEEQASNVGLLVCRRFVNFPYELVPKLYDALFDEVSWATEDEPTQELRDSFRFKHYLLVTRILDRKILEQRKPKNKDQDEPIIYPKEEDEIFVSLAHDHLPSQYMLNSQLNRR